MKWYPFDPRKGSRQKRPPMRRDVLVAVHSKERGLPDPVAVGYRKDAAGDKQSPYFVVPGIGGDVYAWCDCLGDAHGKFGPWSTAKKARRDERLEWEIGGFKSLPLVNPPECD